MRALNALAAVIIAAAAEEGETLASAAIACISAPTDDAVAPLLWSDAPTLATDAGDPVVMSAPTV